MILKVLVGTTGTGIGTTIIIEVLKVLVVQSVAHRMHLLYDKENVHTVCVCVCVADSFHLL